MSETRYVGIITEMHDNDVWGERSTSASAIGVLVQQPHETLAAFKRRVEAKMLALSRETSPRGQKLHIGVACRYETVFDDELLAEAEIDETQG